MCALISKSINFAISYNFGALFQSKPYRFSRPFLLNHQFGWFMFQKIITSSLHFSNEPHFSNFHRIQYEIEYWNFTEQRPRSIRVYCLMNLCVHTHKATKKWSHAILITVFFFFSKLYFILWAKLLINILKVNAAPIRALIYFIQLLWIWLFCIGLQIW